MCIVCKDVANSVAMLYLHWQWIKNHFSWVSNFVMYFIRQSISLAVHLSCALIVSISFHLKCVQRFRDVINWICLCACIYCGRLVRGLTSHLTWIQPIEHESKVYVSKHSIECAGLKDAKRLLQLNAWTNPFRKTMQSMIKSLIVIETLGQMPFLTWILENNRV